MLQSNQESYEQRPQTRDDDKSLSVPERPLDPLRGTVVPMNPGGTLLEPDPPRSEEVIEYFEGLVESYDDTGVRVRPCSSDGEESLPEISRRDFPEGEWQYVELAAPLRVTIFADRTRPWAIRVLRPNQWQQTSERVAPLAQWLAQQFEVEGATRP